MNKEHFSNRIKAHEAPVDPGAWAAMEALLDGGGAMPTARRSGRKYLGLILLLVILSGAGLYGLGAFEGTEKANTEETLQRNNTAVIDQERPVEAAKKFAAIEAETASDRTDKVVDSKLDASTRVEKAASVKVSEVPTEGKIEASQTQLSGDLKDKVDEGLSVNSQTVEDGKVQSGEHKPGQTTGQEPAESSSAVEANSTKEAEQPMKDQEIEIIEASVRPGMGGDIPSGITKVGLSMYESRLKVPKLELPTYPDPIPIERVSFFAGLTEVSTDVIVSSDNELTGRRWNLGASYWLSDRLSLETEYGSAKLSLITTLPTGAKHEYMDFISQHVNLRYRFLETRTFDLKVYGGAGFGKFVYEWYINPAIGSTPNPGPVDVTKEKSNITTIDFGLSVLCKWSNFLVMETRMGIMHNDAFAHGSIMDNYGINLYWTPRRKAK